LSALTYCNAENIFRQGRDNRKGLSLRENRDIFRQHRYNRKGLSLRENVQIIQIKMPDTRNSRASGTKTVNRFIFPTWSNP
jgi:hypothetical protein